MNAFISGLTLSVHYNNSDIVARQAVMFDKKSVTILYFILLCSCSVVYRFPFVFKSHCLDRKISFCQWKQRYDIRLRCTYIYIRTRHILFDDCSRAYIWWLTNYKNWDLILNFVNCKRQSTSYISNTGQYIRFEIHTYLYMVFISNFSTSNILKLENLRKNHWNT